MLKFIKSRPVNSDYDFKMDPVFSAEAFNPVIRADADNPVFKTEATCPYCNKDNDLVVNIEYPSVPYPRITVSEETFERIRELFESPPEPSQRLIDLMNRKPRYEKSF